MVGGSNESVMSANFLGEPGGDYYLEQNEESSLVEEEQVDEGQRVNEIVPPPVHGITLKTDCKNAYTVCEESTAVLPKYGRIRIIKPMTKRF